MPENIHQARPRRFKGKDKQDDTGTSGNESRFVRCKFCGSINDTEVRSKGSGWGNISKADSGATATTLKYDVVGAGCWFCGSSEGW